MDIKEVIEHLEALRNDFKEFVQVETKEKDVEVFDFVIKVLKEKKENDK